MKRLIYLSLRAYVWLLLKLYFSRITVIGRENIPKTGALLFTANHQNAFLDALLIVTHNGRKTHFLAKAEVFNKSFFKWLLSLINMMPIYRVRDGWQNLGKNDVIFDACFTILSKEETILIFPEGNHGFERRLRPLSKGFSRIAFGTLQANSDLDLKIVPVGINYQHHQLFRSRVSVHYGEAFDVKPFYNPNDEHLASLNLRNELSERMKVLITHIGEENYKQTYEDLLQSGVDFSDLNDVRDKLENPGRILQVEKIEASFFEKLLKLISAINLFIPFLCWRLIQKKIADPVMLASIKFAVGISIFPLFLLIQALLIYYFFGLYLGFAYVVLSILILKFSRKSNSI